jgi:hypothetical protein
MKLGLVIFCVVLMLQGSLGFASGAGTTACENLTPNHPPYQPQITQPPVTFVLSSQNLRQGETMTVAIEANEGFSFRGFIVQARTLDDNPQVVGEFQFIAGTRGVFCSAFPQNSVATHTSSAEKTRVELTWRAPANLLTPGTTLINFQ